LDFSLDPADSIVAASLTVSLRGISNAGADSVWLDSTTSPQSYTSLGWTPISTTAPTVRTMEVSPALLADGRLNLAFGTNTAVDFAVLHLQVEKAQPSTQTITLTPVADASVMGGVNTATNYGTESTLVTKDDTDPDYDRETFLRWDLSGVSGKIVQAKVRLAGITTAQTGNESCAAFVSSDTWGETTLTYGNKPTAGKLFAQWLPVAGQPVEFTVTPQVVDTMFGDDLLSVRILSTDNYGSNGLVTYASRENTTSANRPQLILTLENTAPTISDVPNQSVNEDAATTALPVTLGDDFTPADSLTLNGTSSNTTLVPNANIVFGGSGANRTVTITPAANQTGTATITLTVSDGTLTASATFTLTVTAVSDAAIKAATDSALNLSTAWTGAFVPVNPDTATWNATSLAGAMTLGTNLSWAGLIVNNPAAPLTFNGTQTLTLGSGGINMSAATVNLTLNHPVILGENQTWNIGTARTLTANAQISGPGSLTKTGTGSLILSGANSFSGNVTISAGPATITHSLGLGTGAKTINVSNGTAGACELHLDGSTGPIALPANMTLNTSRSNGNGAIVNDAGNNSIAGPISMTGGGGNTLVTVLGGSLALNGNITANVSTGRTLQLAGTGSNAVNGVIQDGSGAASVSVQSGTWTLSGANTHTGGTTVSGGTLALSGSLAGPLTVNGGTFAPRGMPATGGALTLNAGGTFQARINGSTAGTLYDQLAAGGSVTLGGTLDLVAGPGLGAGASFRILNKTSAGAISGTFAGKPQGSAFTDDGYTWIISYLGGDGNDVVLTTATPAQAWRFACFGTLSNSGAAADTFDANGDGELNLLEFATGQHPNDSSLVALSSVRTATTVEITYTRSLAALADGVIFIVEWSETLAPDSWSVSGVTQAILTDDGTLQSVKATVPAGPAIPARYARLKVISP
jgi:autotransporter-associated beta strand protein